MIFLLLIIDVLFVVVLFLAYLLVTRRQMRVYTLVEHLAALSRQNLPLHTGLRMVARDVRGVLGMRLEHAAQRLEEGQTLGDALEVCRGSLPALVRNMAQAGERSGNLAGFFEELARGYRRVVEFHNRTVYAFIYPVVLSVVIYLAIQGLAIEVLPRFQTIGAQLGLPWPSGLWWAVHAGRHAVLFASFGLVALVYVGGSSVYFGRSSIRWLRPVTDRLALAVPVVRRQIVNASMQQFTFTLGMMLRRGAALPEALDATAGLELNGVLRRKFVELARAVREGARFSDAAASLSLPGEFAWFARNGEASGALGDSLVQAASFYETRAAYASHLATRLVVPLFVLLNGLLMLGTWALVFQPIIMSLRSLAGGPRW